MARLVTSRSVLAVRNLERSTEYYTKVLGFEREGIDGGGSWSFLKRDGVRLMLGECPDEKPASEIGNHSYVLYLYVEEIDRLHQELAERGAQIPSPPSDMPWGLREFSVRTPDGHRIHFGEPLTER
jgi:uncharacterized glyoxalase superfamily protein PhnB